MVLRAIRTQYGRIPFKSRLEALWAITFDRYRHVNWEYERLNTYKRKMRNFNYYTPDFLLYDMLAIGRSAIETMRIDDDWENSMTEQSTYIEIKPKEFLKLDKCKEYKKKHLILKDNEKGHRDFEKELAKIRAFTQQSPCIDNSIIVICGPPWDYKAWQFHSQEFTKDQIIQCTANGESPSKILIVKEIRLVILEKVSELGIVLDTDKIKLNIASLDLNCFREIYDGNHHRNHWMDIFTDIQRQTSKHEMYSQYI